MHQELQEQLKTIFHQQPVCLLNCNYQRKDIDTLRHMEWLNSETIQLLAAIIAQSHPNLFKSKQNVCKILDPFVTNMILFMGQQPIILETMRDQQLFTYQYLFIPCNTETGNTGKGSHWFLMVYHRQKNRIYTMDSQYQCVHKNAKIMAERLMSMKKMFMPPQNEKGQQGDAFWKKQISVQWVKGVVKQENSYDCGIHTIGNLEHLIEKLDEMEQQQRKGADISKIVGDKAKFMELRIQYFGLVVKRLNRKIKEQENDNK